MIAGGHKPGEGVGYSIRQVRVDDAAAIVDLLKPIIQAGTYTVMDEPITVEDQLSFIRGFPERGIYHVAVRNDDHSVVGIQDIQPVAPETKALRHVGEISTFVSLELQRSGIGGELTRATLEQADDLGFRKIMATIRADNPDAVAFYERQGFEMVGTLRDHACLGGKYIDEILMERFIGQETQVMECDDNGDSRDQHSAHPRGALLAGRCSWGSGVRLRAASYRPSLRGESCGVDRGTDPAGPP